MAAPQGDEIGLALAGEVALRHCGAKDAAIPLRFGRATQRVIPGSRLEVPPTGQLPFSSQPERFLDVVGPFLAELSSPCAR